MYRTQQEVTAFAARGVTFGEMAFEPSIMVLPPPENEEAPPPEPPPPPPPPPKGWLG